MGLSMQQLQMLPLFNGLPALEVFLAPFGQQTVQVPAGNGFIPVVVAGL
jgi:hypothetical protein